MSKKSKAILMVEELKESYEAELRELDAAYEELSARRTGLLAQIKVCQSVLEGDLNATAKEGGVEE